MSIGCFETDIYYMKDKVISAHDTSLDTNLVFNDFLESNYRDNVIWMDSKNLNNVNNCKYALNWFQKYSNNFKGIMVEIPPSSIDSINNPDWVNCITQISNFENIELGYYLDSHTLKKCSKDIKEKKITSLNCKNLYSNTSKVLDRTKIKSITFDYKIGYDAVNNLSLIHI